MTSKGTVVFVSKMIDNTARHLPIISVTETNKTQKSTFPNEFCAEIHTTDKVIPKNQNKPKKIENQIYGYKDGGPKPKFKLAT